MEMQKNSPIDSPISPLKGIFLSLNSALKESETFGKTKNCHTRLNIGISNNQTFAGDIFLFREEQ
jgi:hypothetical protein